MQIFQQICGKNNAFVCQIAAAGNKNCFSSSR